MHQNSLKLPLITAVCLWSSCWSSAVVIIVLVILICNPVNKRKCRVVHSIKISFSIHNNVSYINKTIPAHCKWRWWKSVNLTRAFLRSAKGVGLLKHRRFFCECFCKNDSALFQRFRINKLWPKINHCLVSRRKTRLTNYCSCAKLVTQWETSSRLFLSSSFACSSD